MVIDFFFLIMVGFGFYFGFTNGVFKVLILTFLLLSGLFLAMHLTVPTTEFILSVFDINSKWLSLSTFFIICIFISSLAILFYKMIKENFKMPKLGKISKVIGGLIMLFFFTILYSVLISFFSAAEVIKPEIAKKESITYQYLEKIQPTLIEYVNATLQQMPFPKGNFEDSQ